MGDLRAYLAVGRVEREPEAQACRGAFRAAAGAEFQGFQVAVWGGSGVPGAPGGTEGGSGVTGPPGGGATEALWCCASAPSHTSMLATMMITRVIISFGQPDRRSKALTTLIQVPVAANGTVSICCASNAAPPIT